MKYKQISNLLFIQNRQNFIKKLKTNAIAIFNSNDEFPRSGDQNFLFKQNADLFYLSGIDQEQSILLLYPDCPNPLYREVLFLRQTNDFIKVWEGHKYTKEEARQTSGIKTVYWLEDFHNIFHSVINYADYIYLNLNENDRYAHTVSYKDIRFISELREKYPLHAYERSAPIMRNLRAIKSEIEVELTQKACDITEKGFRRVLNFVKPGVMEYEIEAEFAHEFLRNRSKGFAYTPIIASGNNANVLHYIENNQQCKAGDLILLDVGAEYANYSSDMTRMVPVSGRFTDRQKAVYQAVLNVKNEATKMLVPGTLWKQYHVEVGKIMTSELLGLGLIDKADVQNENPDWPAYKKYFMHGTSHHMGLDTHDYGLLHEPMQANMVFTVEPGIYIPKEGFGIRLEDDVVIQKQGEPFNLMRNIPIEIEEIEAIMNA